MADLESFYKFSSVKKSEYKKYKISSNGKLIALHKRDRQNNTNAIKSKITIFNDKFDTVCEAFNDSGYSPQLKFAENSQFLLIFGKTNTFIEIFDIEKKSLRKIDFSYPLEFAYLSRNGDYCVTISELRTKLTISVHNKKIQFSFQAPKFSDGNSFKFNRNDELLAVVERINGKDWISIFNTGNLFTIVNRFSPQTEDLISIDWSQDGNYICIIDSKFNSQFLVYSVDGQLISKQKQIENGRPFETSSWSPSKSLLAISDKRFNSLWISTPLNSKSAFLAFESEPFLKFLLDSVGKKKDLSKYLPNVYVEVPWDYLENDKEKVVLGKILRTKYINKITKNILKTISEDSFKRKKGSNRRIYWSRNSDFFAFIWKKRVVIVYEIRNLGVHSIIFQRKAVKSVLWSKKSDKLLFCSDSESFYCWNENDCGIIEVPKDNEFSVKEIKEVEGNETDEKSYILIGRNMKMCKVELVQ